MNWEIVKKRQGSESQKDVEVSQSTSRGQVTRMDDLLFHSLLILISQSSPPSAFLSLQYVENDFCCFVDCYLLCFSSSLEYVRKSRTRDRCISLTTEEKDIT